MISSGNGRGKSENEYPLRFGYIVEFTQSTFIVSILWVDPAKDKAFPFGQVIIIDHFEFVTVMFSSIQPAMVVSADQDVVPEIKVIIGAPEVICMDTEGEVLSNI